MQLETFLETSVQRHPGKTALVCGDRRWTYAELEADCNRLAHALIAAGIQRGDRIALCLDNSYEAVVAVFAVLKAGAVFMPVNPTTKSEKLAYVLGNSRAAALIASSRKLAELGDEWRNSIHVGLTIAVGAAGRGVGVLGWNDLLQRHAADTAAPAKRAIDIDLAALIYTSGSTGNPKGVMLTHLNMVSAAGSITTYLENRAEDIILNVLPLSFDYGLYQVLMAMKFGGTVVLERSFAFPHAVLQKLVAERVTGLPLVPTMAAILLQMDLGRYDLSALRYVTNTGAALPTDHILRIRDLLPHVTIYSMYGLTECKRVSYLPPEQIDVRPGSVGKGMPNEEVYLVDEEGRRLGPGATGELVVRGSNVMKGYWELPEETDRRLKPGPLPGEKVLYTGDLFRSDADGYLYFVGRKDDIIKTRGEKVSPKEVENALYSHPEVVEAAVVAMPDAILGQAIRAVVARSKESRLTERELLRHCAARLEDFMVPQIIEFRDLLPKSGNGKIDKRQLLETSA
ncbi:MAG: AMP-binding protein [Rhodopirellula sp.]|nr:AMP-binding protein [Rhodopirellula sp.]